MNFKILINNKLEIKSVLDIGAHAGWFTDACRSYFPNAYYFMIDGNPISEIYLKDMGVDFKIAYLSDKVKKAIIYKTTYNEFNTGDSFYRENTQYYNDQRVIKKEVITNTLSELFGPDQNFDFIKIDTQGSELDIIKGGIELCKKAKIFLMEVSVYDYNSGAPSFEEVKEFMSNIGFDQYKIVENISHPDDSSVLIQHDVLFAKKPLK